MARFEIRRATAGDLDLLLRLEKAFCQEMGLGFDMSVRRSVTAALLADEALGGIWTARAGDQPGGYVALGYGFSLELGGRDAFVDELFVTPDLRRQGVARALLARAVEDAAAAGVRAFHLEVEDANPTARALYEKFGFRSRGYRLMTRSA